MTKGEWESYRKYFKYSEFDSNGKDEKDTGLKMKKDFMDMLYKARTLSNGFSFRISSGYRTEKYNKKVGGVKNSSHRKGIACDIKYRNNAERFWILRSLMLAGFKRFGFGKTFFHVDISKTKKQNTMWTYRRK